MQWLFDRYNKHAAFDNFMSLLMYAYPTHYDYPFDRNCDVVIDVGGGRGHVLYSIMATYPTIQKGILFDMESQVGRAREYFLSQPNDKLIDKVEFVAGSFFNASTFPTGQKEGRTCYVMRQILHDWNDATSLKILTNLALQMQENDLLLLNEMMPNDNMDLTDVQRMTTDFVMLLNNGGMERSLSTMNKLLNKAGLEVRKFHETRSPFRWAEAVKPKVDMMVN